MICIKKSTKIFRRIKNNVATKTQRHEEMFETILPL